MIKSRTSLDCDKLPYTRVASSMASILELSTNFSITGVQRKGEQRRGEGRALKNVGQVRKGPNKTLRFDYRFLHRGVWVCQSYTLRWWVHCFWVQSFLPGRRTGYWWWRPHSPSAPRFPARPSGLCHSHRNTQEKQERIQSPLRSLELTFCLKKKKKRVLYLSVDVN